MNDSSTGGYLAPYGTVPKYDKALDAVFQSALSSILGIDGQYVRPKWQVKPPRQPPLDTNWVAFSVNVSVPNDGPYFDHQPEGDGGEGNDVSIRHERLEVRVSLYGPDCMSYGSILRDGVAIPQNGEELEIEGIKLLEVQSVIMAPYFINLVELHKCDVVVLFNREVSRVYPIRNVLSAEGNFHTDVDVDQNFIVEE